MAKDPGSGLTDKQKRFCEEYLVSLNAAEAYRTVYGCSLKAAESGGSRMLRSAKAQAYIQEMRSRTAERAEVTLEQTVREIARVAFSDITRALKFDDGGVSFKSSDELTEDVTAAIESVTITETETENGVNRKRSLKMHSKMSALTLLADYFGLREDFNKAIATLKTYGIELARVDGHYEVVREHNGNAHTPTPRT